MFYCVLLLLSKTFETFNTKIVVAGSLFEYKIFGMELSLSQVSVVAAASGQMHLSFVDGGNWYTTQSSNQ